MKFRYLNIFLLIAVFLTSIEIILEYRALQRGFPVHFLNKLTKKPNIEENNEAEKAVFPYRSPRIELSKKPGDVRFWMSSASYAEDSKRKIDELFPNIFCTELKDAGKSCQILNAAKPGLTIHRNIRQLEEDGARWKPDFVILYSMSLDISVLSSKILGRESSSIEVVQQENNNGNKLTIGIIIEQWIEYTTVYGHLRRYLGGSVLLSASLFDDIGNEGLVAFKKTLEDFIHACDEIGATPIFVTFALQYNQTNYREMSYDGKLWLVRYNEYLSPKGWIDTVAKYNEVMYQTAQENNIIYIDHVEKEIAGNIQYFTDLVHFTKEGHKIVGEALAKGFLDASSSVENTKP